MPAAATVKVADAPTVTLWFCGWVVMLGATAVTVRVAAVLVTLPAELLTVTEKLEPLFEAAVTGVV